MHIPENSCRDSFICESYKNDVHNIEELRIMFRISWKKVVKILDDNGIKRSGNGLSDREISIICESYQNGETIRFISNKLNLSEPAVSRCLKKNKIKPLGRSPQEGFRKIYEIDETMFNKIDTFNKAQFLGLIYSDGTIAKNHAMLRVSLREDDSPYLEEWRTKLLKTNKPLSYSETNKTPRMIGEGKKPTSSSFRMAILEITRTSIVKDAVALGLVPNKSHVDIGMPNIPEELKPAFVLGLFEGDGGVCFNVKNRHTSFVISCQSKMAADLKTFFDSVGIFSTAYQTKYVWKVSILRKEDLIKLYKILYADATIWMERKKVKYQEMLDKLPLKPLRYGNGVYPRNGRFMTNYKIKGKTYYIGTFDTLEEAIEARAKTLQNLINKSHSPS